MQRSRLWWSAAYTAWAAAAIHVAVRIDRSVPEPYMGLVIAGMPMLGWWAWMFYTDLASVIAVLLSWRFALQRRYLPSALVGAISLLFRQTNIVWVAFVAAQALIDRLRLVTDLVIVPVKLLTAALQDLPTLAPALASYLPVFAAAIAFVRWNGGHITGDKSNHVPTVHVAQVWYFLAFAAALFSPHLLGVSQLKRSILGSLQTPSRILSTILALGLISYSIHNYTVAHPFLLADNRHYAFYLWRRIINLRPDARYALAPGYFVAARLLWIQLAVLYLAVQAVCVWLFLERPFKWEFEIGADGKGLHGRDERELGRWQRFMW
ncbi:glycosyltransferase family 59 protein [Rhodotorula sp. JG-1b]|nr:glycosyltransferase family 59 protein [Rhodotorula sp. JG-1b]